MRAKFRYLAALFISILPCNWLRVLLFRLLLGYKIKNKSSVGWLTILAVDEAEIISARIARFNKIIGPFRLTVQDGSVIGNGNTIRCGFWAALEKYKNSGYKRHCTIGRNALITTGHYIDVAGEFELGDNSWIAGHASQFWTHGANTPDRQVKIGTNCYIASGVLFAPGTSVGDNTLVGLGSVVTKKFEQTNLFVGGNPAAVIKENYDWKKQSAELIKIVVQSENKF